MPFTGLMSDEVFQQSFMGLSIMDFTVNAGLNSSQSTLSLNLVADDGYFDAYHTLDTLPMTYPTVSWGGSGGAFGGGFGGGFSMGTTTVNVGARDAITEGYHPWDPNAFPATLVQRYGGVAGVKQNYAMNGDVGWFPPPGSPVYFKYYGTGNLNSACVTNRNCTPVFTFSGILGSYQKSFSTGGLTYSVTISDPRKILENTLVILDGEVGRVSPADKHYLKGSFAVDNERKYEHGWNGYYNIINVFGYYESHGFNKSRRNDQGIAWFEAKNGKQFSNNYGINHHFGVLPAIDFIASGTNDEYIKKLEPYGGPAYYGVDDRNLLAYAPFSEQLNGDGVYRYAIDLSALYDLSKYYNPNPPAEGVIDDSFKINGANMSLLQLIQNVCEAAGADFMVEMYAPRLGEPFYATHKDYAGIIRIIPIPRNIDVEIGVLEKAIDLSQQTPSVGPFVDAEQHSILIDSNVGYEFTDPIQGKILFGAQRTRVVGVTPLGDRKTRNELFYNSGTGKYLDTDKQGPMEGRDDILREYMPSIELDGVTLHTQALPADSFQDRSEYGWNPETDLLREGGKDVLPDFEQNLPMVSNDDFLPYHLAEDYSGRNFDKGDPFQFGRVNSKFYETAEVCTIVPPATEGSPFIISNYCSQSYDATEAVGSRAAEPHGSPNTICTTESTCTAANYCDGTWLPITDDVDCGAAGNIYSLFYDDPSVSTGNTSQFKKVDSGLGSGYLDMFPCWGFQKTEYNSASSILKDEINKSIKGQPIKGMFWDDDPYRDFHPINGIFGVLDWINPSLGKCRSVEDFEDPATGEQEAGSEKGRILPSLENRPLLCECDYMTAPKESDCYTFRHAGVKARGKFEPACKARKRCESSTEDELTDLHSATAGVENNLHKIKFSCENACFEADANGKPVGKAIVAYYTEDVGDQSKGNPANVNDSEWMSNPPGTKGSKIKLISNNETCEIESVSGTQLKRVVAPIKADGSVAEAGDKNKFISEGGLYSKECIAISHKVPYSTHCEALFDLSDDEGNEYKAGDWLPSASADDCFQRFSPPPLQMVKWVNAMTEFPSDPIDDKFYGQTIPVEKIPQPGYVNTRFRYTGTCKANFRDEPVTDLLTGNSVTDKFDCLSGAGGLNYFDEDSENSVPVMAKSATIPIDLLSIGYDQGPAKSNNVPGGSTNWYYATITELRHAAMGKDSWTSYLRALGQKLPCAMWAIDPVPENAWSDFCKQADEVMFKGGTSEAHLAIASNLNYFASGGASGSPTINNDVINHAGNPSKANAKSATGHPCGDAERNALSLGERTQMQLDIAYQKVQEVATQFYGRRYLVPLPFNPPTSHTCSNLVYKNQSTCEDAGYDWGPHGMLSEWFQKMGIGKCSDGVSADKFTCEILNSSFWIEPIKHINKWDINSSGWPGGSIDYQWDETKNTGYPQNINFWTEDGNLEPFVVFPSHERKRFSADSSRLDYRNFDSETIHESKSNVGPVDGWGSKVFVKANIDPETHWIPERAAWEIQNEKQYAMYRAGDEDGAGDKKKRLNEPDDYLKVGTLDNVKELKERSVYVREVDENSADYFKEMAAYKPYALITLPNQVLYGDMDQTIKFHDDIGEGKDMCIPLIKAKNSNSLMSAWLQGMDRGGIVGQQLRALGANLRNAPAISPDMGRGSFQAAAYKPWHAAIPQQSKHYKWGPWALGTGFGKTDYQVDTSIQPSSFGGEQAMANYAMSGIKTTLQNVTPYIETGSVTLAGLPAHAFATQIILPINGVNLLGPFITDISVSMGANGLTTTYNFTTQEKFADIDSINRERIRKNQEDMLKMLKHTEEQIAKTKRDITKYIK